MSNDKNRVVEYLDQPRRASAWPLLLALVGLLAATLLSHATRLWTRDKRLAEVARDLGVDGAPGPMIHDRA